MRTMDRARGWDFAAAAIAGGLAVSELVRLAIVGLSSRAHTVAMTVIGSSAFVAVLAVAAIGVFFHRRIGWLFGVLGVVTALAHGVLLATAGSPIGAVYMLSSMALFACVVKSLHWYRSEIVATVLMPLASWLAASCGGEGVDANPDGTISSTSPSIPCDGVGAESTVENGHTHDVCVPARHLSSPPSEGATYTTTTNDEHVHEVKLDAAQLGAIGRGELVRVTTTTVEQHVHVYSLARAGTITPPPQPGSGSGTGTGSGGY
jgi:hypothetical protein